MEIGMSTACFYPQPLEELLPLLGQMGVHTAEVFINTESEFAPAFYQKLGAQAQEYDIQIVSVHPYTSLMEGFLLFSNYQRRVEDGFEQYRRYFACAAELGAQYLTFHGERNMGPADTPARWAEKCAVYHRLCALGKTYGVTLTQENVAWCRAGQASYLQKLRQDVPELHFTLDIKQARRAEQDWREILTIMGERLANVHLNDFSEQESCVLPGQGQMDYADLVSRLRRIGYDGALLMEVYRENFGTVDEMRQALALVQGFVGR